MAMSLKQFNELEKLRKKYDYLFTLFYQINNILIAIAFLWGSLEFYKPSTDAENNFGVNLFIIGSALMFIKPVMATIHSLRMIALDRKELAIPFDHKQVSSYIDDGDIDIQ